MDVVNGGMHTAMTSKLVEKELKISHSFAQIMKTAKPKDTHYSMLNTQLAMS